MAFRSHGLCPGSPSVSASRPRGLSRIVPFAGQLILPDPIVMPVAAAYFARCPEDREGGNASCSKISPNALAASLTG
jgi:hypothetical protein